MKKILFLTLALLSVLTNGARAADAESWQDALAQMPLGTNVTRLTYTNTVELMLNAFGSNNVVKGLVFMPGATDELYFFRRVDVPLSVASPTLMDCVAALTNHSYIMATFRPPLLLLHTTEDMTEGFATVKSPRAEAKLKRALVKQHLVSDDQDWDTLYPGLSDYEKVNVKPGRGLESTWHFYRHTFAAWNLSEWDLLETMALAGKTKFTLTYWSATYSGDIRRGPIPAQNTIRIPAD